MVTEQAIACLDLLEEAEPPNIDHSGLVHPGSASAERRAHDSIDSISSDHTVRRPAEGTVIRNVAFELQQRTQALRVGPAITVLDFVERKFIPEYVAPRGQNGRIHFRTILNYVLSPEAMHRVFRFDASRSGPSDHRPPDWPYMDGEPLANVTTRSVQHLISTALNCGYSIQTATHIRNLLRCMFAQALESRLVNGENPASSVVLPRMQRQHTPALSLDQLTAVLQLMRYPERELALMVLLTKMSVAEVCGLKWKFVNLGDARRFVNEDWVDGRTAAIRMQSHRGQFGPVTSNRRRNCPLPELVCSVLNHLRTRDRFTGPDDFVFASRCGSAVSQDNIAMRRLKSIGNALGMPWLCWHVFHHTHSRLLLAYGRQLHHELKAVIHLERTIGRNQS